MDCACGCGRQVRVDRTQGKWKAVAAIKKYATRLCQRYHYRGVRHREYLREYDRARWIAKRERMRAARRVAAANAVSTSAEEECVARKRATLRMMLR
jgi:hypothetical protein